MVGLADEFPGVGGDSGSVVDGGAWCWEFVACFEVFGVDFEGVVVCFVGDGVDWCYFPVAFFGVFLSHYSLEGGVLEGRVVVSGGFDDVDHFVAVSRLE